MKHCHFQTWNLVILCIAICFYGCTSKGTGEEFNLEEFEKNKVIGEKFSNQNIIGAASHMAIGGDYLYINTLVGASDSTISVIDIPERKFRGYMYRKGGAPDEVNIAWNIKCHGGKLYFEDGNEQILFESDGYGTSGGHNLSRFTLSGITPDFATRLKGTTIVKSLSLMQDQDTMSAAIIVDDTIDRLFMPFPNFVNERIREEYPLQPLLRYLAYQASHAVKRDQSKLAVGYMNTDLISIYDEEGRALTELRGPINTDPVFRSEQIGKGIAPRPVQDENRNAYLAMDSSRDKLFALYSGHYSHPSTPGTGSNNTLIVIDWDDYSIESIYDLIPAPDIFTVNEDGSTIFGLVRSEDYALYQYEL